MMSKPIKVQSSEVLAKLWIHESSRVFQDGLVSDQDKKWFTDQVSDILNKHFQIEMSNEQINSTKFGSFHNQENTYQEITDKDELLEVLSKKLEEYNSANLNKINIVFFDQAVEHVLRITRVLSQPRGYMMLVGAGGSGKESLIRISTYLSGMDFCSTSQNFGVSQFKDFMKSLMFSSGIEGKKLNFVMTEAKITSDTFLGDLNDLFNSGEIPNLMSLEDIQKIEKYSTYDTFIDRVKDNLHICLALSPVGDSFRHRCRMYPSMVNACTIDWIHPWNDQALNQVSQTFLKDFQFGDLQNFLANLSVFIHNSVINECDKFYQETSRYVYLTPQRFIDFMSLYQTNLAQKMQELNKVQSLQAGINDLNKSIQDIENHIKDLDSQSEKKQIGEKLITNINIISQKWNKEIQQLSMQSGSLPFSVLLSSACLIYFGPFLGDNRKVLLEKWVQQCQIQGHQIIQDFSLFEQLGDQTAISSLSKADLPQDHISVENSILMKKSSRCGLCIDPQQQAYNLIQKMTKDNQLVTLNTGSKTLLRDLMSAVRNGKTCLIENVGEKIDQVLDPILMNKQYKTQDGIMQIRLGDQVIDYDENFKLIMTTKIANPHYSPEDQNKVNLINFTITEDTLIEQLQQLQDKPELVKERDELLLSINQDQQSLKNLEVQLLKELSEANESMFDQTTPIIALEEAIKTLQGIKEKQDKKIQVDQEIDDIRNLNKPMAVRGSLLYFVIADLAYIDPTYQPLQDYVRKITHPIYSYSLHHIKRLFQQASNQASSKEEKLDILTRLIYTNISQGLFDRDRILFSFMIATAINRSTKKIRESIWRLFLQRPGRESLTQTQQQNQKHNLDRKWDLLPSIEKENTSFEGLCDSVVNNKDQWESWYSVSNPLAVSPPLKHGEKLDAFEKLVLLRVLNPTLLPAAIKNYVISELGQIYVENPNFNLEQAYKDTDSKTPLILILSRGMNGTQSIKKLAEKNNFADKLKTISLGQGQGVKAELAINNAVKNGEWVFLTNCHQNKDWMPRLNSIISSLIKKDDLHQDFRLILDTQPTNDFPEAALQNGIKFTIENPKGLQANLLETFNDIQTSYIDDCKKPEVFKKLLFGLSLIHAVILDRQKYGTIGWNLKYEFSLSDLTTSQAMLKIILDKQQDIPWSILQYLIGDTNFGGRVTDDKDRRLMRAIIRTFIKPDILEDGYKFSKSGLLYSPKAGDKDSYLKYIQSLPSDSTSEMFGLHENAEISLQQSISRHLIDQVIGMQQNNTSGTQEVLEKIVNFLKNKTPEPFDLDQINKKFPLNYQETMNTVLYQECMRYNRLLTQMKAHLTNLQKALKGMVVMAQDLKSISDSIVDNQVPQSWKRLSSLSFKPLSSWIIDLNERIAFLKNWIDNGAPNVFWFSGFFFPQAFLTGTLQMFARKHQVPIDQLSFDFKFYDEVSPKDIKEKPEDGCFITGLYLEGCRWNTTDHMIDDSLPKQLFVELPVIQLLPKRNRVAPSSGVYQCPLYRALSRTGVLSTTGHSTNFVMYLELPTKDSQDKWIKAGVAAFLSLID